MSQSFTATCFGSCRKGIRLKGTKAKLSLLTPKLLYTYFLPIRLRSQLTLPQKHMTSGKNKLSCFCVPVRLCYNNNTNYYAVRRTILVWLKPYISILTQHVSAYTWCHHQVSLKLLLQTCIHVNVKSNVILIKFAKNVYNFYNKRFIKFSDFY